ncbi:hypothetical protein HFO56_24670 [Rhizobium laguerreae]|uniref:hypothetical protein n=1 Tax=Rhizobium laguerreae TaxID=1076926 RepID=UPI001C909369|nr:hypothetical protein [Rhizobium laguerreae]MBY3155525.1 hypothetical protein [Rhizobium laguerreae]
MASVKAQLKSLIAELTVALISAYLMYHAIVMAAHFLGILYPGIDLLATIFVFPFPAMIVIFKTVLPRTVSHRSYRPIAYILLSQLVSGLAVAILLEGTGECFDCGGNLHDVFFYAIALGTPYGLLYAFFSKIFSIDVDSPKGTV